MKSIIVLGASASKNSINHNIAHFTASLVDNVKLISIKISDYNSLPIFSVDHQSEIGIPKEISALYDLFQASDGFIISFAEYNGSFPAAYKNVIDWLSVHQNKVFNNKPMLLLSTSPGPRGGQNVLDSALSYYPFMGGEICGALAIPSYHTNFEDNKIVDNTILSELKTLTNDFQNKL